VTRVRVLALSPVPEEGAGCRFRISQYVPALSAAGFDVTVSPFFTTEFFRLVYRPGHYPQKAAMFLRRSLDRLRSVADSTSYDLLFLYREAFPIGPPFIERLLARRGRPPIVYDFDDAVFLPNTSDANRMISFLKYPEKIDTAVRLSTTVVAGNAYLADYARQHNSHVTVIPTCVDTSLFVPRESVKPAGEPLVCGWIGTPTTASYLEAMAPVFARVHREHRFELRVAGAGRALDFDGVPVSNTAWSLKDEVALFNTCDIGVYPLSDDEWTHGKCGFKAIQFMSCGVPVVAAAVGVNTEIIEDGVNGFLASNQEEWTDKLGRLASEPHLRRRMGEAGRQTVRDRYSLVVNAPRMAATLQEALERGAGRN
jgi:glycosyltransferase involved in cell wall biosynthesis